MKTVSVKTDNEIIESQKKKYDINSYLLNKYIRHLINQK